MAFWAKKLKEMVRNTSHLKNNDYLCIGMDKIGFMLGQVEGGQFGCQSFEEARG
jgi:hypothetical protein